MITIRPAQMQALRAAARDVLSRRLAGHVRASFPAAVADVADEELLAAVARSVERAYEQGLASDRDVAAYVDVEYAIGAPPESRPWAAEILADAALPPAHRAHLLVTRAAARLEQGDV